MKICKSCNDGKLKADMYFYTRKYKRKDGSTGTCLTRDCKECCKKRSAKQRTGPKRDAYLKYQRAYHKTHDRDARLERLAKLDALKGRACADCGHSFPPECMDFDHVEPKKKLFTISNAVVARSKPWDEVLAEIAKCRLICSNCHRIRTAKQFGRGASRSSGSEALT